MIMKRNTAPDLVPYWDFDAREAADSPRDASAGALYAAALIELSTLVPEKEGKRYLKYAERILKPSQHLHIQPKKAKTVVSFSCTLPVHSPTVQKSTLPSATPITTISRLYCAFAV